LEPASTIKLSILILPLCRLLNWLHTTIFPNTVPWLVKFIKLPLFWNRHFELFRLVIDRLYPESLLPASIDPPLLVIVTVVGGLPLKLDMFIVPVFNTKLFEVAVSNKSIFKVPDSIVCGPS